MPISVLICDDSSFARKQMAKALPSGWNVDIHYATDGLEGLEVLKATASKIVFLDLNMPVLDGYQVLEHIQRQKLDCKVIVISGDIQPEAHERVMALGALAFIKKPCVTEQVKEILEKYNLLSITDSDSNATITPQKNINFQVGLQDIYAEVANIAMGRAADLLARLLDAFVIMPIPKVNMIELSELHMALHHVAVSDKHSAVCQGFIGAGIAGEAFMIFNESSFTDIASLMKYNGDIDEDVQMELLMDISNILIGACTKGIAEQLDLTFSLGHPVVLGRHVKIQDILKHTANRWQKTLAIEIAYTIENKKINCDLLLLFTEDSIAPLNERLSYLID
ncbi:MAG: response regulator [Gammaproteobacteria bacterium]|nr:response regulator [Gammaproteobacteria bacterium]